MEIVNNISEEEPLEWRELVLFDNMSGKPIIVYHYSDNNFDYYKPYKKYRKIEFEILFNFKMGSPDYDCNRIVKYSK
tara:strand:- start:113 stop:343 length:231 start_codon:yes stop_codon:yes gene_type:complete